MLFDTFPYLAECKTNGAEELSAGERQMLMIARTLIGNPSLILLDELSEGIAPVIVESASLKYLGTHAQLQTQPEIRDTYLAV